MEATLLNKRLNIKSIYKKYSVTFIDQYGCSQFIEFAIPVPQEPIISSFEIINELTCADASNGVIGVSISGGYGDRESINELKGIIAIGVGVNQNDK